MATIGSIEVNLKTKSALFTKGLKQASSSVTSFAAGIAKGLVKLTAFGAGLTAVAGAGLALLVKKQFAAIDVTAKLSDRLGIATEKLIGLRHAAELAGVGTEALDKSLEQMVRRLGEVAVKGSGEAKDGMEALGLSVQKMIAMSPDQQFRVIAEGIRGLGTQAEKAAVAYQFFGRQGVALLNVLETGTAGLDAAQKGAEKLGLTYYYLSGNKIQNLNNSFTALGAIFKGVFQRIAIETAPIIGALVSKFNDAATAGEGMGAKTTAAFESMALGAAKVIDMFDVIKLAFKGAQILVTLGIQKLVEGIDFLLRGMEKLLGLVGIDVDIKFFEFFAEELAATVKQLDKEFDKLLFGKSSSEKVKDFFNKIQSEAEDAARAATKSGEKLLVPLNKLRKRSGFKEFSDPVADLGVAAAERTGPSALLKGSTGAANAIARFSNQLPGDNASKAVEEKSLKELEFQTKDLKVIAGVAKEIAGATGFLQLFRIDTGGT